MMNMIHLVNIEQKTNTQDPVTGSITESWAVLHENIYCDIEPLSVKDFIQSRAIQSDVTVRIKLPYLTGLTSDMRIVGQCGCHSGKIYNPQGFLEDAITGQEYITAPCSEGVNEG